MPLYEYQCDACGREFELIRKFSDPPLEKCPHCGGTVRKLFSSPAIQFKGSGWYITDYAKKSSTDSGQTGSGSSNSSEKSDKSESGSKSGDKSDSGSKSDKSESSTKSERTESSSKPDTSTSSSSTKSTKTE